MKFDWKWKLKHKDSFMGRWGGGWKWKLGICIGLPTIFIELLIASLRIELWEIKKK